MLGLGLAACLAAPARAEENPFGYSYTAATEEPGETEVSLWTTDRRGKDAGHYDAQDYRLEVERRPDGLRKRATGHCRLCA